MILSRAMKLTFPDETKYLFYDVKKLFYTYKQEEINLVFDALYEQTNEIFVISMTEWEILGKLKPMIFKWVMTRGGMSKVKGLTFKFANWNNYKK